MPPFFKCFTNAGVTHYKLCCPTVCGNEATRTLRIVCGGRTIFCLAAGLSPTLSGLRCLLTSLHSFSCLPPVPGCATPHPACQRWKSAFDGPVGTNEERVRICALTDMVWHRHGRFPGINDCPANIQSKISVQLFFMPSIIIAYHLILFPIFHDEHKYDKWIFPNE